MQECAQVLHVPLLILKLDMFPFLHVISILKKYPLLYIGDTTAEFGIAVNFWNHISSS